MYMTPQSDATKLMTAQHTAALKTYESSRNAMQMAVKFQTTQVGVWASRGGVCGPPFPFTCVRLRLFWEGQGVTGNVECSVEAVWAVVPPCLAWGKPFLLHVCVCF